MSTLSNIVKNAVRAQWGLSVLATRNAGRVVVGPSIGPTRVDEVFDAVMHAGHELHDEWIDQLIPGSRSSGARYLSDVLGSARRLIAGGPKGAARTEVRNKIEVFRLVKEVRSRLGLPQSGDFPLHDSVARAYEADDHRALWLVEGLGHEYVAARLLRGERPRGLFQEGLDSLPRSSVAMLHAGLGLAVAEHLLERLAGRPTAAEMDETVRRFVELCRRNSALAYLDTALEALGLVARCFHPHRVPALDAAVRRVARRMQGDALQPMLRDYLWHGIGRGIYFIPTSFVPGFTSIGRAIDRCEREAPDQRAREAALAGLAYAFNLVNMAHPEVMESLLAERGSRLVGGPFGRGLVASFVVRREITPDYPFLQELVDYRTDPSNPRLASVWRKMVHDPCRRLLAADGRESRRAMLGGIYQSLDRRPRSSSGPEPALPAVAAA